MRGLLQESVEEKNSQHSGEALGSTARSSGEVRPARISMADARLRRSPFEASRLPPRTSTTCPCTRVVHGSRRAAPAQSKESAMVGCLPPAMGAREFGSYALHPAGPAPVGCRPKITHDSRRKGTIPKSKTRPYSAREIVRPENGRRSRSMFGTWERCGQDAPAALPRGRPGCPCTP